MLRRGAAVNRVTKKPLTEDRKAISFTTGSFNTLRSTLDFTGPLNEDKTLLYRLNLAYENSDDFRDLQEFKSFMVAPSITFLPTDNTRINFDLVITNFDGKLDRGQPTFGAEAGTDLTSTPISFAIGAANDYHKTNVAYSTLSLNHQFTEALSFNASYMRYSYQEELFEHRTSNQFAVDSLGEQIPTLMGMRISTREQETNHRQRHVLLRVEHPKPAPWSTSYCWVTTLSNRLVRSVRPVSSPAVAPFTVRKAAAWPNTTQRTRKTIFSMRMGTPCPMSRTSTWKTRSTCWAIRVITFLVEPKVRHPVFIPRGSISRIR